MDKLEGALGFRLLDRSVIAQALRECRAQFPRIGVRPVDDSANETLLAVARAEAAFGISYLGTQEPDLEFEPLIDEDFVLALPCRPCDRQAPRA